VAGVSPFGGSMIARLVLGAILTVLSCFANAAETFRDCSVCPTMLEVPRGKFLMGTAAKKANTAAQKGDSASSDSIDAEESTDEQPQHSVTFEKPFALGQYPVTRGEFAAFVQETHHDPQGCFMPTPGEDVPSVVLPQGLSWRNPGFEQTDRDPVVCVSFNDAKRYVEWLKRKTSKSYRLPTEAEWEYAARAGTTTPRYWPGSEKLACRFANVLDLGAAKTFDLDKAKKGPLYPCDDGHIYTAPSGSFPANAFGLYDMLGNVWQWIADCYTDDYKSAPTDGSKAKEPEDGCRTRVLRGGSWATPIADIRSAYRHGDDPDNRTIINGIRVARSL